MNVLITGAGGQLGKSLLDAHPPAYHVTGLTRAELDVTDLNQVKQTVARLRPEVIIHTAAYTAVDLAEAEPEKAYQVNVIGSRNVALAAEEVQAKLCYVSTDYVFDGTAASPYREYDNPNPQTVYGKTKRTGEQLVQSLCSRFFIVRTAWLYGLHGHNFVKTMLELAHKRKPLRVVHDQIGSPTNAADLASFLFELVRTEYYGVYHAANAGACSWYEFAEAIFELSGVEAELTPCTTAEFPRPAPRPANSVLDQLAACAHGFAPFRCWRDSLQLFLESLGEAKS